MTTGRCKMAWIVVDYIRRADDKTLKGYGSAIPKIVSNNRLYVRSTKSHWKLTEWKKQKTDAALKEREEGSRKRNIRMKKDKRILKGRSYDKRKRHKGQ